MSNFTLQICWRPATAMGTRVLGPTTHNSRLTHPKDQHRKLEHHSSCLTGWAVEGPLPQSPTAHCFHIIRGPNTQRKKQTATSLRWCRYDIKATRKAQSHTKSVQWQMPQIETNPSSQVQHPSVLWTPSAAFFQRLNHGGQPSGAVWQQLKVSLHSCAEKNWGLWEKWAKSQDLMVRCEDLLLWLDASWLRGPNICGSPAQLNSCMSDF